MNQDNQENDLVEQMEGMNIVNPVESESAWQSIYQYMYPQLKSTYDFNLEYYHRFSRGEFDKLYTNPARIEFNIERHRNEMARIIEVRTLLRRLAGHRR